MSDLDTPETPQTTVGWLLSILRESKNSQLRLRKARAQKEFMIARRIIQQTYRELDPSDLPVDLQRLRRDLEITRDQEIQAASDEVEQAFAITHAVIMSVADTHPAFYREPVAQGKSGAPEKIARYLSADTMVKIARAIEQAQDGLTSREVCEAFSLTEPTDRMAAKRYLGWLRTAGHLRTSGSGKGMKYMATKTLRKVIQPMKQGAGA